MKTPIVSSFFVLALSIVSIAPASAQAPDKIATLSNSQLSTLVSDLDNFYKQALDRLFELNKDEDERALGTRVEQQLLAGYDARVAGRCTKIIAAQSLNQYTAVVHARMSKSQADADRLAGDFARLLEGYGLNAGDLRKTGDCPVFEYDLEPLYESPLTVVDSGFWWWQKDRQTKTFIRIIPKAQKADGTVELEAHVGAGNPKGTYHGIAKRDLHSTSIQVSLMRDGAPLLIDGEISMSGQAYKDPLTNEAAPKMPARCLSGLLTIHDGARHAMNNAVLFLARESDATIGGALGGLRIPGNASYGSYLNVVLVSFKGAGVGEKAAKFAALVDDAYKSAQKDNPVTSFHPTRKPLFLLPDEVAFLVTDIASDVNALAAERLKSAAATQAALALGATNVQVVPFWKVKDGKLVIRFPGRPAAKLKFKGFEQLARAIFTMYAALGQEEDRLLEKYGIKALSDEVKFFQGEIAGEYKAMGPLLDGMLDGRAFDAELDKELSGKMDELLKRARSLSTELATILDTRDGRAFADGFAAYARLEREIAELAAAGIQPERADGAKQILKKLAEVTQANIARADALAGKLASSSSAIRNTLNYMNEFTVRIELGGTFVGDAGKLSSWTWTWERTLSPSLEAFFMGEKYEAKHARRGD